MASPVIKPEDVLETLMNDGTIDAIRLKIINQLKANVRFCAREFVSGRVFSHFFSDSRNDVSMSVFVH